MQNMIPIDLEINMLRCFKEVAETGSFTRAGKNIGLTQAGVSIKIRRLEERLNARIFNRTSKNLSLTFEGETLMEYARRILSAHDEAVGRLTTPKVSGRLRIGLIDYFLPELLPGLLTQFRKQYPNIHLDIRIDIGIHLLPLFEKGELDLVVADKDAYEGISGILIEEPLIWVIGKDTEAPPNETIPLIVFPPPCNFRKLAVESLGEADRKWEIFFTGNSTGSIQTAVQAGLGISILPMGALKEGLRKVPSRMELPELPKYSIALYSDKRKENEARDVFVNYLEAELDNRVP